MHMDKLKPIFQIRVLEFEKDGTTFKKGSKSSNIYPNSDDITIEELWKKIKELIDNDKRKH